MTLHTVLKKTTLALFVACGSVLWLSEWHQNGYTRSPITFPPVSTWWRDAFILLIPLLLAVWLGSALVRRLAERSARRTSLSTQAVLAAVIFGGLTTVAILLVENSRIVWTGIGNELTYLSGICGRLYPNGNPTLDFLQSVLPISQATRVHILLQDGMNLILLNCGISLLMLLLFEGMDRRHVGINLPARQAVVDSNV
ncbi:MAG: hypothetical protein HRF47_02475 [Chloroflexota bacterium]|jgi:hypothetical protein